MEQMYRRLEKYALDPDNKTEYAGRADQWQEYTEKWQKYHENLFEKARKNGIMSTDRKNVNSEKGKMQYTSLGEVNTAPLVKEFGKLQTDKVIITDERYEHIKIHHPQDFELFEAYAKKAVTEPDEILVDSKNPGTIFMIKRLPDTNLNVIVRLALDSDEPGRKNSVMTFYRIRKRNLEKLRKKSKCTFVNDVRPEKNELLERDCCVL